MRRVDRQTNALPDRQTDRPTDTASYRSALSHLKSDFTLEEYSSYSKAFLESNVVNLFTRAGETTQVSPSTFF